MRYAKFLAQVVSAVALAVIAATDAHGTLNAADWVNVVLAGVLVIPVFYSPNDPHAPVAKAVVAAVSPVFVLCSSLIIDGGLDSTDIWQLLAAAAGALLVYAVPNAGTPANPTVPGPTIA